MNPLYADVAIRAGMRCEYCRAPESVFNFPFEVEHIIPRSRDGADTEDNLALACRACNLFKSDHTKSLDPETQQNVELFHPRTDVWDQHFQINLESVEIIGTSPKGRATVTCLQVNSDAQVAARRHWRRLGVFP